MAKRKSNTPASHPVGLTVVQSTTPAARPQVDLQPAPAIGLVAGHALQESIAAANRAFLNLLRTAAILGPSEPLAAALLDMPDSIIRQFEDPRVADRMMDLSFGFPLFRGRIQDPQVLAHIVAAGSGDAAGISALTSTLPLEVIEKSTRRRTM